MSFSNPRRTPMTRRAESPSNDGLCLRLKTGNLGLPQSVTFHSPTTPPTSSPGSPARSTPSLPRRSQTSLEDVLDAHRRRAALALDQFDITLSSNAEASTAARPSFRDESLPVSQGLLEHMVVPDAATMEDGSERRALRPRRHRSSRHHESDSGLGSSIATKQSSKLAGGALAITRSVAAAETGVVTRLSERAKNRIQEHLIQPLLDARGLKDFRPIVQTSRRQMAEGTITCLRDLERTLIYMAPEHVKSAELCFQFFNTSIRCIQATVDYLSDHEQTRPGDRPYTNGYFIDLAEQLRMHVQQMREAQSSGADGESMDIDPTDELKLVGGIAETGRPAQLVRFKKNGDAFDAVGQPIANIEEIKGAVRFKRSLSEQAEDEEEILRSMARRKKNASPAELAPKKCKYPDCTKQFARPCDLTKHEKTHSRPWKCEIPTCKYHEDGWPTEKERDRHMNDKHSDSPVMFECQFKPCPYKSKRESNCKQHMEKAHGYTYTRSKTNGKKAASKAGTSAQPTPVIPSMPTPTSERSGSIVTPIMTPADQQPFNFATYPHPIGEQFNTNLNANVYDEHLHIDDDFELDLSPLNNNTPSSDADSFGTYQDLSGNYAGEFSAEDLYGATVAVPQLNPLVFSKQMEPYATAMAIMSQAPIQAPHISPAGHGNTMLFTPQSMTGDSFDVDEGYVDGDMPLKDNFTNNDFLLFPNDAMDLSDHGLLPSTAGGFSQPSSQVYDLPNSQFYGDSINFGPYDQQ